MGFRESCYSVSMGSNVGGRGSSRPMCVFPGCGRTPDVRFEIRLGGETPAGAKSKAENGVATVCDEHAAEMRARLGPGRILGESRMG